MKESSFSVVLQQVRGDLLKKTGTSCLIWPTSPEKLILRSEIL